MSVLIENSIYGAVSSATRMRTTRKIKVAFDSCESALLWPKEWQQSESYSASGPYSVSAGESFGISASITSTASTACFAASSFRC